MNLNTNRVPTGTVTFLFTDIESSTRLWEIQAEGMKLALARHDEILRQAIESHQGYLIKSTGDGCYAAFPTAAEALEASLAAQQALCSDPWSEIQPHSLRVRMGIHTGEAESRAGDYFGPAVNRTARLMSSGHGGQVLISASTAELGRDSLPAETTLLDLGEHRLKDLNRPEHIFQLVHPALPVDFPPIQSLDSYPNNLPVQLTGFIGRARELQETRQLLSTARLVTLTGSGGTGKTRLAEQVGAELLSQFLDGVWLVELATVSDPEQVYQSLASVFELPAIPDIPLLELLTEYLHNKRTLILLDNCEHLVETCAALANHLLRSCSHLKILATSRESLGIDGETAYRVPNLSLPTLTDLTPDTLSASEAVQLFNNRAAAANPRFKFTETNAPAVAQVCRRLDGIPLALELAAARLKLFTPEQIAVRLDDRFRLLSGGSRTALPRQQTLRALIDWSYDLLTEPEQSLLRKLSIFVGGWSFEAAEAVCLDLDVLILLEQLVNKSMVIMDDALGEARFRMLETIRQYGREKLIDSGEETDLRNIHLDYFLRLSEEAESGLNSSQALAWFDRLDLDVENIRAAIEWGKERRPIDALILMGNLNFYWTFQGDNRVQALNWLNALLNQIDQMPEQEPIPARLLEARAKGAATIGQLCLILGDSPASVKILERATQLARKFGDKTLLAYTLATLAAAANILGDTEKVRRSVEEGLAIAREAGSLLNIIETLPILAGIENQRGNQARADQLRQECRHYLEKFEHPFFLVALRELGMDAIIYGHMEEARVYLDKGLELSRKHKFRLFTPILESDIAHLDRETGNLQAAKEAYSKLIWTWKDFGQYAAVAHLLECLAYIALSQDENPRAARLFGAAQAIREKIHVPIQGTEYQEYEKQVTTLRNRLDAADLSTAWAEGGAMDMEAAIQFAAVTG